MLRTCRGRTNPKLPCACDSALERFRVKRVVASGGEASRLMLILKTAGRQRRTEKTTVFDEIDIGIGGRVAEAVGRKLKGLAETQQVFCVTHQPQIASLADHHFVVAKSIAGARTRISVCELSHDERIEELARMLRERLEQRRRPRELKEVILGLRLMVERHGQMRILLGAVIALAVCVVAVLTDLSRLDPFGPGLGWSPGIMLIAGITVMLLVRSGQER